MKNYLYILAIVVLCSCHDEKDKRAQTQASDQVRFFCSGAGYKGNRYAPKDQAEFISVSISAGHMPVEELADTDSIVGLVYFYAGPIRNADTLGKGQILATGVYRKQNQALFFYLYKSAADTSPDPLLVPPLQTSIITTNDLYAVNDLYLAGKSQSLLTFIDYHRLHKSNNTDGELQRYLSDKMRKR